jgi:hypothetical protein
VREIHKSPFFHVTVDDERRIVRRSRTERGFETLAEAQEAYESMLKAIDRVDRVTHMLLVDMRPAPPRNDPGFEQLVGRLYPRLYSGFPRIAALTKTQAGRLQLTRVAQTFGYDIRTFMTEPEALSYLEGGGAPEYPSRATATPESRSVSSRPPGRRGF